MPAILQKGFKISNNMKKISLVFLTLISSYAFIGVSKANAEASCSNARCHTVGEGYCLPGSAISFRSSCPEINCLLGQSCDWEMPGFGE